MSLALQPSGSWVELVVTAGTPDTTLRLAPRPWPDPPAYYGGLKDGRITKLGDVVRALSDRSGSPVVGRFSFEVFDRDGSLRALLEAVTYLTRSDLTYYIASARAHDLAVLADPRVGFRGQVLAPAPTPNRLFAVTCESRMGTRYGPFDYDSPILKRAFETTDFPSIPRENQGKAVPFLWGELSDEGTLSASPGPSAGSPATLDPVDVAAGMATPIACGYLPGGTPGGPTHALPPTNLQVTVTGTGERIPVRIGVLFRNSSGMTTLTSIDVASYPKDPGPFPGTATHYATWTWDDPNSPPLSSGIGYIDTLDGTGWHLMDAMYLTYTDDGDDEHDKSRGPKPPSVNTAVIGTTATQKRFYCLTANPGSIITIYKSNLEAEPAYEPVEAGDPLFDLGGGDGYIYTAASGRQYFGFLAQGPPADAHDAGTMPFRVNLCGWTSGSPELLIDQAAYVYQDVIVQLQGNDGQGWQGGARLAVPSFSSSPSVPIVQTSRFEAVQDQTIAEMGTSGSALGALATVYLDSFDLTWRGFIEQMNRTFGFDSGENHHGQFFISMQSSSVDVDDGPILREFIDVRAVADAGAPHPDEIENAVDYQYDWHPTNRLYRSGIYPLTDQQSIDGYGLRKRPQTLDLVYTRDPATAVWSAQRYLDDRKIAPRYPVVVNKFRKALAIELGTQYRVEHSDLGAGIFVLYCREQAASVERGEVTLRGRLRAIG